MTSETFDSIDALIREGIARQVAETERNLMEGLTYSQRPRPTVVGGAPYRATVPGHGPGD